VAAQVAADPLPLCCTGPRVHTTRAMRGRVEHHRARGCHPCLPAPHACCRVPVWKGHGALLACCTLHEPRMATEGQLPFPCLHILRLQVLWGACGGCCLTGVGTGVGRLGAKTPLPSPQSLNPVACSAANATLGDTQGGKAQREGYPRCCWVFPFPRVHPGCFPHPGAGVWREAAMLGAASAPRPEVGGQLWNHPPPLSFSRPHPFPPWGLLFLPCPSSHLSPSLCLRFRLQALSLF
jgi:hypothetical protein